MQKKQILVVEDQDLLLMAIRDVLEMEGYTVITASDGVEGLEMMERCTPDLIIADISMPRMDGYKF
ncbi:MAG TPA: response regulator, partial [Anaerolineae bacterium]|nr:response regulator [Anaerolineae bacterium]